MEPWLPEDAVLKNDPEILGPVLDRYRRMLLGSGYGFWEWNLKQDQFCWGGSFWQSLGYSTAEDVLTNSYQIKDYVHPDDFSSVRKAIMAHLKYNQPLDISYRAKAHDGSYCWTQSCANSTRDSDGRVVYLSGINFNISRFKATEDALRLSEARNARVLSAAHDGIWEWAADAENGFGRFDSSDSAWEHLGYTSDDRMQFQDRDQMEIWRSHMHPDDMAHFRESLRGHFVERKPFDVEYRIFDKQGNIRWMRTRGQAVFNESGRAYVMSGINIDISRIKLAEEKILKAKEDAEKANQAKSDFLSSMSHELRTPLNAILGFTQLFDYDNNLTKEQTENVYQIRKAGQHLLQLINDVLDLAKIESGKMALSLEPVMPYRLVEECFTMVSNLADKRNIRLLYDRQGLEDVHVVADSIRLKQSLLNLLSNAVKYNVDGGEVMVRFQHEQNNLVIAIEDTGPGIPYDKEPYIFEPFNRLGAENTTVEGSGVGLVITRQLIEMMGGTINYCPVTASGACFKVSMPIAETLAGEATLTQAPHKTPRDLELVFSEAKTILYVEDNPSNIRLMEQLFSRYDNLTLLTSLEAFVGLYKARTEQPDLIIMDINLPGISGYEALEVLKQDELTNHIPVIALSANAMAYDIVRGKEAGFDDYLTKPLDVKRLIAVFNQLLTIEQRSSVLLD